MDKQIVISSVTEREKLSASTSWGPPIGPLMGCNELVLCALAFPEATSANSLHWPSSNSDEKLWVIDDAELMVSWEIEKNSNHFLVDGWEEMSVQLLATHYLICKYIKSSVKTHL